MRNLENEFIKRTINYNKLKQYGFRQQKDKYIYKKKILDDNFEVQVIISKNNQYSKIIDIENSVEYVLVDVEDAVGEFVGKVRQEYEKVLQEIIDKCAVKENFKSNQAKEIIEYVRQKYGDKPEFLWEKYDDCAAIRNKQNEKWYAVLLTISEDKLKHNSDKVVEIIDLKYDKENIDKIIDNKLIFSGYHMNKKSWITIILDYSLSNDKIFKLIDNSYNLSIGNKCGYAGDLLSQKVYEYLTLIPKGKVVTYKQVAEYIGNKGLARAVGNILHKNPDGDKYPCYKVLNSKGELAEAFVFGGKNIQKERLEKDAIKVIGDRVDLKKYQWKE